MTRALGPVAAAPVSVLWVWWGFAGAALTFPLQHWITRSVTVHEGERAVRQGAAAAWHSSWCWSALVAGLVSWLARDLLFRRADVAFPLLVVAVALGSGVLGVVRGTLTARRRFAALGAAWWPRTPCAASPPLALMVAGVEDPVAYGVCLVVGLPRERLLALDAPDRDTGRDAAARSRRWRSSAARPSGSCSARRC